MFVSILDQSSYDGFNTCAKFGLESSGVLGRQADTV